MGFLERTMGRIGSLITLRGNSSPDKLNASKGKSRGNKGMSGNRQNLANGEIGTSNTPDYEPVADFGGTRTSVPRFTQGGGGAFGALPKKSQRDLGLDDASLRNASIDDLMDILSDAHPDVSFALWNFVRIGGGDFKVTVKALESDDRDETAELEIANFLKRLEQPNVFQFESSRSLKKVVNQLIQCVVLRGAGAVELVLTQGLDDVAFIAPVDTATVDFKFEQDRFVPYQDEEKLSLDMPTFLYEALDERVDDPYGRSPFVGAINTVMFQLQVLNDIKAVVHNQGYPRFDIKVLEEVLIKRMPIGIRNNDKEKQKWLNAQLTKIIEMYSNLDPDDAFVHYDSVEVGMAGGGKSGGALIDPQKLMTVIDNMAMAGLKTLSTILGRRSTGNTESFAKMEIKLYMKGVEAIQEVVERILSRALTLFLNVKGIQGSAEFRFDPVEIRTDLEKAQFELIALQNYAYMRDQGWIDNDEASRRATGSSAVAEPDWEHLGKATVKNKDGAPVGGQKDDKTTDSTD